MHQRFGKLLIRMVSGLIIMGYLGYSFFVFNDQLNTSIQQQANAYLMESSAHRVLAVENKLHGYLANATMIADLIEMMEDKSLDAILVMLQDASDAFPFSRLSFTYPNGTSYSNDGLIAHLGDRDYIQQAMLGESVVSDVLVSRFDGNENFMVATPVVVQGDVIGVLHGTLEIRDFNQVLQVETFGGDGLTYLVNRDGLLLYHDDPLTSRNFFAYLLEQGVTKERVDLLRQSIEDGENGYLQYLDHGKIQYLSYRPVEFNQWYVFGLVPGSLITEQTDLFFSQGLKLSFRVALLLSVVLCYLMFVQWRNSISIKYSKDQLEFINANIQGGVYKCGVMGSGYFDYMSDGFLNLLGYEREEIENDLRNVYMELVYEADKTMVKQLRKEAFDLRCNEPLSSEYRMIKKDGSIIWVIDKGQFLVDEDGIPWYFSIILDNTQEKMMMDELHYNEQRYRILVEQSSTIVFDYDYALKKISMSSSFVDFFGYAANEYEFPESEIASGHIHEDDIEQFRRLFLTPNPESPFKKAELRVMGEDYEFIWCRVLLTTMFDEHGVATKGIGRIKNIDLEKKNFDELMRKAKIDELTGLYNKNTTQELISVILSSSESKVMHGFLVVDVDDFKLVNDTQGHLFGDHVLADIGQILKGLMRSKDVIGRMGGDEFIVFLRDIPNKEFASQKAKEICNHLELYQVFNPQSHRISCSIGIGITGSDRLSYEELFMRADKALYKVKNSGKNTYYMYSDMMDVEVVRPTTVDDLKGNMATLARMLPRNGGKWKL